MWPRFMQHLEFTAPANVFTLSAFICVRCCSKRKRLDTPLQKAAVLDQIVEIVCFE